MTSAAFLELCERNLSKEDASLLECCTLGCAEGEEARTSSDFINKWLARERTLIVNLAQARAAKLKREAPQESRHDPPEAETQARAALALENPLEAELLIDKGRWDAVEALAGTDYFGVNTVYAYLLKLRLMERRSCFKTEEGFSEYKALYAGILENAPRAGA
jgi:hypothetical protein